MAVRGRKPKPAELKLLTGNPGRRPVNESEASLEGGAVNPPSWLDDRTPAYRADFLGEWHRITRKLTEWGVIGEVNQGALEGICALYAQAVHAARNADATETRQSFDAYRKSLSEFGLTPASKGKSGAKVGRKAKDPSERFFGAG